MSLCKSCNGTGWEYVGEGRAAAVRRCQACVEQRRGFAPGVPKEEQETGLASWGKQYQKTSDNADALEQAGYFLSGVHPGLYIYGGVGTGKTALACGILNDLHRSGVRVRFIQVSELLKQVVQPETGDQVYERLLDVEALCLDDLGAQKASDYARQMLLMVCDGRYSKGHRTIWTSNLDLDSLAEFFNDERLASRLVGNTRTVLLDGVDYRLKRARERKQKP